MNGTLSCVAEQLELGERNQRDRDAGPGERLPEELGAGREAEIAPVHDLGVVVGETDGAEGQRGADGDPDEGVGGIGPEHRGQQDGDDDKDAAHGRRARFFLVRLRPVFADVLADLEFAQLLDDVGADEHRNQQRSKRRKDRAET